MEDRPWYDLGMVHMKVHHASAILLRNLTVAHTGIGLIQDPWVVKGAIRGLGNLLLVCFRNPKEQRPRACIAVKGVNVLPLLDFATGDLMAVQTELEDVGRVVIASAYLPYDSTDNPTREVQRLVEHCMLNTNARGVRLLDYLAGTDLEIMNVGNTPTFRNAAREEVIDLTLSSTKIAYLIGEWRVSDEPSLSDHSLII
ncbi:uncharacterized protein LOC116416494 [Nasonia vitripennis]|uniref:Endonuclease/exonuclease/phosphatase domain-containing protein n=1 Tax=Nasonia vitripennis TaxID=7425 RepID=A0A7M7Q352_NASVI|nr:uncharacterized protein LOC116416494 [Nasonia vitripennis]